MQRSLLWVILATLAWLPPLGTSSAEWTWEGVRPVAETPSAAFSPNGQLLAVLDGKGCLRTFDVASGKEEKKTTLALGPGDVPERVSYDSGGDVIVLLRRYKGFKFEAGTATQGTVSACLWKQATGKRSPLIEIGFGGLAVCPKGELLAYGGGLWEVATGKQLHKVSLPSGLVYEIDFSPNGKTLLYRICESLAQDFALLFLADAANGKKVLQIGDFKLEKHQSDSVFLFAPKFSPDGTWLAFSETDRPALHLRQVGMDKASHRISLKELEQVVGISPDNKTLFSWHRKSGSLHLWEIATGKKRKTVDAGGDVDTIVLSPDGNKAAALRGIAVKLHDLKD